MESGFPAVDLVWFVSTSGFPRESAIEKTEERIETHAQHANCDHSDQYLIRPEDLHAVGNQIAQARSGSYEFSGDYCCPAGTERYPQANDDTREGGGQYHPPKHRRGIVAAQNLASLDQYRVNALNACDSGEKRREEGADEHDKDFS
jgi:hypothetical protein